MKWYLYEDNTGKQIFAREHFATERLIQDKLSEGARIIWSCDAKSPFDAQARYAEYQGFKYFRLWHTLKAIVTFKFKEHRELTKPYQEDL